MDIELGLFRRIHKIEYVAAAVVAIVLVALIIAEPAIVEAPFENSRTLIFTVGGTVIAAIALVAMLRLRVPPIARLALLGVPFLAVNWWLLSPYFIDDVADEEFSISIAGAANGSDSPSPTSPPTTAVDDQPAATAPVAEGAPALLGAGMFRGLAGHDGTGDAGIFELADGSQVLRLENLDIQNGPDLRLYLVPGSDQTNPGSGSLNLGKLRGNVGNLTYEIPADYPIDAGTWTVLVWCEAFGVEFVGATVSAG